MTFIPDLDLTNRIIVGADGRFQTLKEAVDWFNANATSDMEIILDAGNHEVADTITVNQVSDYSLAIKGLASSVTCLNAVTGLTNKPMFIFKTDCDLNRLSADGSDLENYGDLDTENFINFDTADVYSEITDVIIETFYSGIKDTAGAEIFLFNFIFEGMTVGVHINHSNAGTVGIDVEVGNFVDCATGINFASAVDDYFTVRNVIFFNPVAGTAILYDGDNYAFTGISEIVGCSYNMVGTFLSGFDFTRADGRDRNINIFNNIGAENKNAHAKINVVDNSTATTITTAGTYYKANFVNTTTYACKATLADNKITYQPNDTNDCVSWISGNIQVNGINRNVGVGLRKNNTGNVISPITVRIPTSSQPFAFSIVSYLEDVTAGDYYEIFVTSSTDGDEVILQDINWYFESR